MDNTVNRPINKEDLQVGDEVIVRGIDLNYMQIVRPPKQKQYKDWQGNPYTGYTSAVCNRLNSKFGKKYNMDDKQNVRFDFEYKSIWLVKRENNN
tara:strand:- start:4744 stop:5028 length:285 start_codon:yes stop_codon:yes gene_type:complete